MSEIAWKSRRAEDNLYRDGNDWNTDAEWKAFSLWYPFSLRSFSKQLKKWREIARCHSREDAKRIAEAVSAASPAGWYIVLECRRYGAEGREKPVLFFPNEWTIEEALK